MNKVIIGWDIGGAHLKAAVIAPTGETITILQQPCPLWQGLTELQTAVTAVIQQLPALDYCHALTMTGELVDCFAGRDDGVQQILSAMQRFFPDTELLVYSAITGLLKASEVTQQHYAAIASANWLASANYAAQKRGSGLFIDIGSTTTDILLLDEGKVVVQGYTDYDRLVSGELVYTGIIRTAVMAVAQTARDGENEVGLMAEYFATMADVYRLTGELNEAHDQYPTADGQEKTQAASARRLARMIGADFFEDELPRWQRFAGNLRHQQQQKIQRGAERQFSRVNLAENSPVIGAGVGRFLAKALADSLGRPYVDFTDLSGKTGSKSELTAADCAPAIAVAYLALDQNSNRIPPVKV